MRIYAYLLLFILALYSCTDSDSNIAEAANGTRVFSYQPIGWQITIPQGWYIMNEDELRHKTYASQQFYEHEEENTATNKIIFGLNKIEGKQANSLYAFVSNNIKDHKAALKAILNQQYAQYTNPLSGYDDYKVDSAFRLKEINGKNFYKATLRIEAPNGGYYEYINYSTMIDTLNFGGSITTTNAADKKRLQNLWQTSIATLKQ